MFVFIIVVLGFFVWRFFYAGVAVNSTHPQNAVTTEVEKSATVSDKAQTGASDAMEKANTFSAKVNPIEGYKNPFE